MILDQDGTFSVEMKTMATSGMVLDSARLAGRWRVTGTSLVFTSGGSDAPIINTIIHADGATLTLKDPSTGLVKPFEKLE